MLFRSDTPYSDALRATRGAGEPYDGVAELWWESLEELSAATASPEGRAAGEELLADEQRFIDHATSVMFLCEEHPFV